MRIPTWLWDILHGALWGLAVVAAASVFVLAQGCHRAWGGEGQPRTEEHAGVLRGGTDPAGGRAWWLDADDGVTYRLTFDGKVPVLPAALRALKGRRVEVTHRRGVIRVGPLTFLLVRSVEREPPRRSCSRQPVEEGRGLGTRGPGGRQGGGGGVVDPSCFQGGAENPELGKGEKWPRRR